MALLKNFARIFMLAVSFILLLNCPVLLAYTQEKIQIAYPGVTLLILPLMIGEEMGLFKDEGLDVTAVQMRTSIEMQALTSGYVDYAMAAGTGIVAKESFSKNGEISEAGIRFVFKMAHDAGQIGGEPRISDVLDFGLLRQAQNEVRVSK